MDFFGSRTRTNLYGQMGCDKVVLRVVPFFAMVFDPIFRWLQELIVPNDPDNLNFLQLIHFAFADEFVVASSSFQRVDDCMGTSISLCGVHCGVQFELSQVLLLGSVWPRTTRFSADVALWELWVLRCAICPTRQKYVRSMIWPDGHFHRWTAHRKIIQRVLKIDVFFFFSKVSRFTRFLCWIVGSVCAPVKATFKVENHVLQCSSAGLYNAFPSRSLGWLCWWPWPRFGGHLVHQLVHYLVAACSTTLSQGLE